MKRKMFTLGILAVLLFSGSVLAQQDSTLYKVLRNPRHFLDKPVTIFGIVEEYVDIDLPYARGEQRLTVEYILRGDFGDRIHIRSHLGAPETNTKYQVTGMFQLSSKPEIDYEIIETRRELVTPVQPERPAAPPPPPPAQTFWDQFGLIILIAGGVIVLLLIVILAMAALKKKPQQEIPHYSPPQSEPMPAYDPAEHAKTIAAEIPSFTSDNDFKTIKVAAVPPKTMRFIPGSLEIVSGEDKGKVFKMVGYPEANGSVVTMGRESGTGERAYSHIQLKDPTVSRKQAEIIFKEGKLYLKNLSETNFTQVNGKELAQNEQVELKSNDSVIRTGAIEFKYVL